MQWDQMPGRPLPRPGSRLTRPTQGAPHVQTTLRPVRLPRRPEPFPQPDPFERMRLLDRYIGICLCLATIATLVSLTGEFFMDLFSDPLTFADALWQIPFAVIAGAVVLFLVAGLGECAWHLWRTRHQ